MERFAVSFAALCLAGCATPAEPNRQGGIAWAALGETVYVDGPKVTPVSILEDSRCPASVQCVWAGTVRITARIQLGDDDFTRELELAEPIGVADGVLELVAVRPPVQAPGEIDPKTYRFSFRFSGGLASSSICPDRQGQGKNRVLQNCRPSSSL